MKARVIAVVDKSFVPKESTERVELYDVFCQTETGVVGIVRTKKLPNVGDFVTLDIRTGNDNKFFVSVVW